MSRFFSYINSSKKILDAYDGLQPFPFHIKKHFAANKQFGSRDRKTIAEICYAWLRTSHLFDRSLQDKNLVQALFLCTGVAHPLLAAMDPELDKNAGLPPEEKLHYLGLKSVNIFPFTASLGNIDREPFFLSFLTQPLLFLRLRPGKEKGVIEKLQQHSISFSVVKEDAVALENTTKIDELISLNKEAVVQDRNSQRVFDYLSNEALPDGKMNVWDCCAASGGKSILLFDRLKGKVKLTVSDIRSTILQNCKRRLQEAGININYAFVADVSTFNSEELSKDFSIIICDAPCTGSGTWSRTPEQLACFKEEKITEFSSLQKQIAGNASKYLDENGLFFYITCSVFEKENEEVVAHLQKENAMKLVHMQYLPGYQEQADTMFVAVLRR